LSSDGPGLVHVYTGDGKGKTTAALGLALRMVGHGGRALVVQFLKSPGFYNECRAAERIDGLEIHANAPSCLVFKDQPDQEDVDASRESLLVAKEAISSGGYQLVVLDEIFIALSYGLVEEEEVIDTVGSRGATEVVMTGRGAPPRLMALADYITEMRSLRHPYERGVLSRSGIDK
jgi:cob(I)alamin adenosyltransferase